MHIRYLTGPIFIAAIAGLGFGQEKPEGTVEKKAIPIYVTPYYDSDGLKISVGEWSEKLANADAKTILPLSEELKKQKDQLRAEVMYVAAVRLYDLGFKDEAVYWFYTAQYRARVFGSILAKDKVGSLGDEAFELKQAYNSFNQLAGNYLNGYAFGELGTLEKTLAKVIDENKSLPKYGEVYPQIKFVAEEDWAAKNLEVSQGLTKMIGYIKANAESIKEQRRKNGLEGKF